MDSMVTQHLDLYDWGTSNPIYSSLASEFVHSRTTRGQVIVGITTATTRTDPQVAGIFDTSAIDGRVLTQIQCGEGSYLEKVRLFLQYRCASNADRLPYCIIVGCFMNLPSTVGLRKRGSRRDMREPSWRAAFTAQFEEV